MATPLGISFSTDENAVAQTDVQLLNKMVESLIVEFDQGKIEEFLSSSFASPKVMWHYRKVSSETRSRISSKITPKVACTTTHNASDVTTNEVLKTFRAARASRVKVP